MKVKTLIKKLQALDEKYQNAVVTIQDPRINMFVPIDNKIKTNYCSMINGSRCDLIVILKQKE